MHVYHYLAAALTFALAVSRYATAQEMPLRSAPADRYATAMREQVGALLPQCPLQGEALCLHTYSTADNSLAIVEVCRWVVDTTKPYPVDAREGIYLLFSSGRVVKFPWFDPSFNRWSCIGRYATEYDYRVRIDSGGYVSRIFLEYHVNQEAGTYELAPQNGLLRVLKHKSADLI